MASAVVSLGSASLAFSSGSLALASSGVVVQAFGAWKVFSFSPGSFSSGSLTLASSGDVSPAFDDVQASLLLGDVQLASSWGSWPLLGALQHVSPVSWGVRASSFLEAWRSVSGVCRVSSAFSFWSPSTWTFRNIFSPSHQVHER